MPTPDGRPSPTGSGDNAGSTNFAATRRDPLARLDAEAKIGSVIAESTRDEHGLDSTLAATQVIAALFPGVQYQAAINSAGVPVRRLVLISDWEVDPTRQAAISERMGEVASAARDLGESIRKGYAPALRRAALRHEAEASVKLDGETYSID